MKNLLYAALLLFSMHLTAQDTAKIQIEYGVKDHILQGVYDFENISINQVKLTGTSIDNKHYQLILKEYVKGTQKNSTVLFDSSESDAFKVEEGVLQFIILSKITDRNDFKVQLQFNGHSSKKYYFELKNTDYAFALKDFLGSANEIEVPISRFPILALITPTVHTDGSASYCEVAQSDIAPEDLGKHYNMTQNFILEMKFK